MASKLLSSTGYLLQDLSKHGGKVIPRPHFFGLGDVIYSRLNYECGCGLDPPPPLGDHSVLRMFL